MLEKEVTERALGRGGAVCVVVSVRLLQYTGLSATPSRPRTAAGVNPFVYSSLSTGRESEGIFPSLARQPGSARVCSNTSREAVGGEGTTRHAALTRTPAARLPTRDSRKDGGSSSNNNNNKDPSVLEVFPYFQAKLRDRVLSLVGWTDGSVVCVCGMLTPPAHGPYVYIHTQPVRGFRD